MDIPFAFRVVFGNIEGFKVIIIQLYFRAVHNVKSHTHKYFFDIVQNDGKRVTTAHFHGFSGQGDINFFGKEFLFLFFGFDFCCFFLYRLFNLCTDFVGKLTDDRSFFRG